MVHLRRRLFLAAIGAATATNLLSLLDALVVKTLIDQTLPSRDLRSLGRLVAALLLIGLMQLWLHWAGGLAGTRAIRGTAWHIRMKLLRHLSRISFTEHRRLAAGDAFVRIESDVDQIAETGGGLLLQAVPFLLSTVTTIGSLIWMAPWLVSFVLPLQFLLFWIRRPVAKRLGPMSAAVQEGVSRTGRLLQEFLPAIPQLQLLNHAEAEARLVVRSYSSRFRMEMTRRRTEALLGIIGAGGFTATTVITFGVGGLLAVKGGLSTGSLIACYGLLLRLVDPFSMVIDIMTRFKRVEVSADRVLALLRISQEQRGGAQPQRSTPESPCVQFINVGFRYDPNRPVLKQFNLRIYGGEKVAIIGPSGAGKTTIGRLLTHMTDADEGQILLEGLPISAYSKRKLRSHVFFSPQETLLLDRSIRENILLGTDRDRPDCDLWSILEAVRLKDLVERLPQGLNSMVGAAGLLLSGGERQRLVLARCYVRHPQLLILDEPASAIDPATEFEVLSRLVNRFHRQTIIVITHRVSALSWADRVLEVAPGLCCDAAYNEAPV